MRGDPWRFSAFAHGQGVDGNIDVWCVIFPRVLLYHHIGTLELKGGWNGDTKESTSH